MIFHHYSDQPVIFDRTRTYNVSKGRVGKPDGLWLSCPGDDDWPTWCRNEEFSLDSLSYQHNVTLHADAPVLWITTATELDAFCFAYSGPPDEWYTREDRSPLSDEYINNQRPIEWDRVAATYHGIIITPYLYSHRFGPMWYYGWDCASGCIWNLSVIDTFQLVAAPAPVDPAIFRFSEMDPA